MALLRLRESFLALAGPPLSPPKDPSFWAQVLSTFRFRRAMILSYTRVA